MSSKNTSRRPLVYLLQNEPIVSQTIPNKRYTEAPSLAVRSGGELGQDEEMDDLPLRDVDGDLDADLAELSLGQRLTALSGGNLGTNSDDNSDSESESEEPEARGDSKSKSNQKSTAVSGKGERKRQRASLKNSNKDNAPIAPANSLTRTLIQALHSSDSRLLESCLAHSDVTLIRNSVRRLPPQLAVPLINSCVERLGRGARAGNMKGGGAGTSTQRGSGLISWIKAVLAVHSGYLMTVSLFLISLTPFVCIAPFVYALCNRNTPANRVVHLTTS